MPITRNGTPFTWMSAPMGFCCSPNNCFDTVCPITTTRAAVASSSGEISRPASIRQLVIGG